MSENKTDLNAFSEGNSDGVAMPVLSPVTGEPMMDDNDNAITITVVGKDSQEYRKAQRGITDRRLARRAGTKLTADRLEAEANEVLARCTKSWQGIVFEGEELECNYSNAKKLYTRVPFLKELVDEFVSERANFLGD